MPNRGDTRYRQISQRLTALLSAVVFALQSGCALFPNPPAAQSTEYQATLGKVAVVAAPQQPEIKFKGIVRGKGDGAAKGAREGITGECMFDKDGLIVGCAIPPLCLVVLGFCGSIGAVIGAATAPSAGEVRTVEAAISTAMEVKIIQEALRNQVVVAAVAKGTTLASVSTESAQNAAQLGDYRSLTAAGVDTVLEVSLTKVGIFNVELLGEEVGKEIENRYFNQPLPLTMMAHVRVIRTGDNAEVFTADYVYLAQELTLSEWSANQAQPLLRALAVGYETLGSHIYDNVFMLYPFPDREGQPGGRQGFPKVYGLAPIYPVYWSKVYSLQPTLHWQRFPRVTDIKAAPEEMGRVKNVRYDLIIVRKNSAPGEMFYLREGLSDPMHTIETSLSPATDYLWTVRARFELDGRERTTEWGSISIWVQKRCTSPSPMSYRFKTPK